MALRKSHGANLRRAVPLLVQTGLIAVLLLLIVAFRADLRTAQPVIEPPPEGNVIDVDEIPLTQHVVKPPSPRPPAPIEVAHDPDLEPVDLDLDPFDQPVAAPGTPPLPPNRVAPSPTEDEPEVHPFLPIEDMPEMIPNNEEGMRQLQQSINYPEIAKRAGVEGRVIVQFVVDEQGNVRDPFVVRGIGAGCDEEALRAVRDLKFKPGKQRGKAVKVQMTLPITFRLR